MREKARVTENRRSGGGEGRAGGHAAQFQHAVTDVAIFRQMSRGYGFTAASHHLVERVAIAELRVEFLAKFTRSAGSRGFEAADDGMVDVIHKELLGRAQTELPFVYEAESYSVHLG
jgi:hypothetical protein